MTLTLQSADTGTTLPDILKDAKSLFDYLIAGKLKIQDFENSPRMAQIENQLERGKDPEPQSSGFNMWT